MDSIDKFGEQFNIENALKSKVLIELPEILEKLEEGDLFLIAENYGIRDPQKIGASQIVKKLSKIIPSPKKLAEKLLLTEADEYELFLKLLGKKFFKTSSIYYGKYGYLKKRGIIFSFYNDQGFYLCIPEQIKEGYDKINKAKFKKEHDRIQLVLKYIKGLCNLYGIVSPDKVVEIFNSQNDEKINKLEFNKILKKLFGREQQFTFHKGFIADGSFEYDNYEDFDPLLERSSDKPYYIPEKNKLLKYSDDDDFEMTPQLSALKDYVLENMCQDEQMVEYLMDDVDLCCSMECSLDEVFFEFERRGIYFENIQELRKVTSLIMEVYNNSRIWSNRGHTPSELHEGKEGRVRDIIGGPVNVTFKNREAKDKVGRNDPCPCGSGKKYKKCCGR